MKDGSVLEWLTDYMEKHAVSIAQTARETGIPDEKLRAGTKEKLTAEEFLELCVYLKVRPEEIREELKQC